VTSLLSKPVPSNKNCVFMEFSLNFCFYFVKPVGWIEEQNPTHQWNTLGFCKAPISDLKPRNFFVLMFMILHLIIIVIEVSV
jgi:hypothetical protein